MASICPRKMLKLSACFMLSSLFVGGSRTLREPERLEYPAYLREIWS